MDLEPILVLKRCDELLSTLGIEYFLVGSYASGIRAEFRATNDIDLVCKLDLDKTNSLIESVKGEFYCDEETVKNSVRTERSFNLIHEESICKIDFFTKITELEEAEFSRADEVSLPDSQGKIVVSTTEYNILAKLRWYLSGGKTSSLQPRDIKSLIRINRDHLDLDYLHKWSIKLGLDQELKVFLE